MIVGISLTTFFVAVIAYYMVRGYRQQNNPVVNSTEPGTMVSFKQAYPTF